MAVLPIQLPKRFPTYSTDSEALARCDTQQIFSVISGVLLKARAGEQYGWATCRLVEPKPEEALT